MIETKAERYGGTPRADLEDRDFVDSERRAFPIMTAQDVRDAVSSWGRYKGPMTFDDFKQRLTAMAKRKKLESALPAAWSEEPAVKAGRRHSANDEAMLKEAMQATKAYYRKMEECLKALGYTDADEDGDVDMNDMPEVKALSTVELTAMVCDAVCEALEDLDLIDDDEPDEQMRSLATMAQPVMADYQKSDAYPTVTVYATSVTEGYAIACLGPGVHWRIPFAMEGAEVVLDTPDGWERVGQEWEPIPGATSITSMESDEVKILADGTIVAQAIRFGSPTEPDLSHLRDYFTKATDFWLDRWSRRPMLYHHAMDEGTKDAPIIGEWTKVWTDDGGVWLQGQLDRAHKYHAAIKELAKRGLLRVSTDSAPHLVQRDPMPGGVHYVKTWPIIAGSLTVAPAEPRLLPAELKTLLADCGLTIADPEATTTDDHTGAGAQKVEPGTVARRLALELDLLALETPS